MSGSDLKDGMPLITVGLTCYNAVDTIDRAIASAIAQDWPSFEIVVVDDKSGDQSLSRIQAWAARDQRIRFEQHETNRGAAAARNSIVRLAKGEFIAWFDDDDESHPSRLRVQ